MVGMHVFHISSISLTFIILVTKDVLVEFVLIILQSLSNDLI